MAKREYLIVMCDRPDELLDCYSRRYVAHSIKEAIENFAKWELGIRGNALKRFLEENDNGRMLRALPYSHDIKKMREISNIRRATAAMGNKLPGYLDKYRRPSLPQDAVDDFPDTEIMIPLQKALKPKSEVIDSKGDLSDWQKDLLRHWKEEHHKEEDNEYDYNK